MEQQWWKLKVRHLNLPIIVEGMPKTGTEAEPDFVLYDPSGKVKFRTPRREIVKAERLSYEEAERDLMDRTAELIESTVPPSGDEDEAGGFRRPPPNIFRVPQRTAAHDSQFAEQAAGALGRILRFGLTDPRHRMLAVLFLVVAAVALGWSHVTPHRLETLAGYELFAGNTDIHAWEIKWAEMIAEAKAGDPVFDQPREGDHPLIRDVRSLVTVADAERKGRAVGRWNIVYAARDDLFVKLDDTETRAMEDRARAGTGLQGPQDLAIAGEVESCFKAEGVSLETCYERIAERRRMKAAQIEEIYDRNAGAGTRP